MKVIISGKCHGYYPDNRLTLHSNLFIIGAQVSQFDLSKSAYNLHHVQLYSCQFLIFSFPNLSSLFKGLDS